MTKTRTDRVVTDEEVLKYDSLIESWLYKSVVKNFNEASMSENQGNIALGNTGYTMNDIRQYLRCELVIALKNYNSDKGTKESTYVFLCLQSRIGQLMKRLTKRSMGYGIFHNCLEEVLGDLEREE